MKYCSNCGVSLTGSAASFCSECGKRVSKKVEKKARAAQKPPKKRSLFAPRTEESNCEESEENIHESEEIQTEAQVDVRSVGLQDVNYDGYYNDVLPEDEGYIKEKIEPELIKRIALIVGVMLLVVILSVLLMRVL